MIKVHVWWRGATPDEINTNLADPIERQMATVDGLDYLESSSIEGMYTLVANFKYGVNVDVAYQDALAAMARVARQLPKDIDPPMIFKADPSQLPVVQLTIRSDQWDLVKLRTWTDNWLQDQLLAVPGVAGTDIVGGLKREIRVHLDPNALEKYCAHAAGGDQTPPGGEPRAVRRARDRRAPGVHRPDHGRIPHAGRNPRRGPGQRQRPRRRSTCGMWPRWRMLTKRCASSRAWAANLASS